MTCPPREADNPAGGKAGRIAAAVVLTVLAVGAAVALFTTFFASFTPDVTFYMMHARTFTRTLNRYILCFGEKGPVLTFLLAPAVWLLGPTIAAAATEQVLAYLLCGWLMFRLVSGAVNRTTAFGVAVLFILASYSPYLWGTDIFRPEYLALAMTTAVLVLCVRRHSLWSVFAGGVLAALCFHMKTVLILAPGAITFVQVLLIAWARSAGPERSAGARAGAWLKASGAPVAAAAGGALLVTALVVGWLAAMDSIPDWWRQNLDWPVSYKVNADIEPFSLAGFVRSVLAGEKIDFVKTYRQSDHMTFSVMHIVKLLYKLTLSRMILLYLAAIAGLVYARRRADRRLVLLLAAWLAAESFKVCMDDRRWMYTLAGLLPPMLLSAVLLGLSRERERAASSAGWLIPLVLLLGVIPPVFRSQAGIVRDRVIGNQLAPYEDLAARMRPHYRKGEFVYINAFNWGLSLILDSPDPYRVWPHHVELVNEEERRGFYEYYATNPPVWIVVLNERQKAYPWGYDWIAAGPYECLASNDYAQAWRRTDTPPADRP